jgi:hypothetical protein
VRRRTTSRLRWASSSSMSSPLTFRWVRAPQSPGFFFWGGTFCVGDVGLCGAQMFFQLFYTPNINDTFTIIGSNDATNPGVEADLDAEYSAFGGLLW